jgi:hypothetical protein
MSFSYLKAKPEDAVFVFGPPLSPSATEAERRAYRRDVLHLPGPVDRWLVSNIRSPRINFLHDYLLLIPEDITDQYVICIVEIETEVVRSLVLTSIWIWLSCLHSLLAQITF